MYVQEQNTYPIRVVHICFEQICSKINADLSVKPRLMSCEVTTTLRTAAR